MAMPVIAAEEAAGAASSAAAAHKAKKAAKAAKGTDPRKTAPGSKAAQQRQQIENIKANGERRRKNAEVWAQMQQESDPSPSSPGDGAITTPSGRSLPVMPAAASTGSGFLLGVFAWALGLAYLRGGGPEVRRLLAAKFFNKTEG